jgi:NAD(P)-dependent dehydrogenase (short-subunit alcohol dehydrogenase family)
MGATLRVAKRWLRPLPRWAGRPAFVAADLNNPREVQQLVDASGPVDILVNNAGLIEYSPTEDLDVPRFDRLFAANVRAPYFLVAAIAPKMAARGSGSIVNVGSMAGQVGFPDAAAYSATKAALGSLTRSWAAEFSPCGVRVNAVASGPVFTPLQSAELTQSIGDTLHRAAKPEEIANVIAFLASPNASYMTGAVVAADGGRSAV